MYIVPFNIVCSTLMLPTTVCLGKFGCWHRFTRQNFDHETSTQITHSNSLNKRFASDARAFALVRRAFDEQFESARLTRAFHVPLDLLQDAPHRFDHQS